MSIQVVSFTHTYGPRKALDAMGLEAPVGEITGLLGPNGAGKSTLMRCISTYFSVPKGHIYVHGMDVAVSGAKVRRMIGYLPENNPLYKDMYVRELLSFFGRLQGLTKAARLRRQEAVIEECGLSEVSGEKIHTLSKGYRQRVGIARMLIHSPSVLILDEATSGLDPNQIKEMRRLIRSLRPGRTILFSTHILQEIEALCDRIVLLNKGKVVESALLLDFRKKHGICVEAEVLCAETLRKEAFPMKGLRTIECVGKHRWKLHIERLERKEKDIEAELRAHLRAIGIEEAELWLSREPIERIFERLTKKKQSESLCG